MSSLKNFIPHTRPHGKKELLKTIKGIKKQLTYWKSVGYTDEYDIQYWKTELDYFIDEYERLRKRTV